MPGGLAFGASASGASRWRLRKTISLSSRLSADPGLTACAVGQTWMRATRSSRSVEKLASPTTVGFAFHMAMDAPEDEIPVYAYPLPPNGRSSAVGLQP